MVLTLALRPTEVENILVICDKLRCPDVQEGVLKALCGEEDAIIQNPWEMYLLAGRYTHILLGLLSLNSLDGLEAETEPTSYFPPGPWPSDIDPEWFRAMAEVRFNLKHEPGACPVNRWLAAGALFEPA